MAKLLKTKRFLFRFSLIPPKKWKPYALVLVASFFGLGFYVFKLSNAASYMSDDPKACINCHIMTPQYLTWTHSSHREVAHCNDCHVPHDNIFNKYAFKAKDGLYHASIFTLRAEPQVIRALEPSVKVIQNNCVRCHQDNINDGKITSQVENYHFNLPDRLCWDCHREVPHGKVKSLSAVGHQIEQIETYTNTSTNVIPNWLLKSMQDSLNKN